MVHAWMSSKATARLVLGKEAEFLPGKFLVDEKRWKQAVISSRLLKARN